MNEQQYQIFNEMMYVIAEIRQALRDGKLDLTDVIDAVIQVNAIIGVGKYSLAQFVSEYIENHKGYDPKEEQ